MTLNQFMKTNSVYEKEDGTTLSHAEYYETIINTIGLNIVAYYIPFSAEQICAALKSGDIHLNTLPLAKWDAATGALRSAVNREIHVNTMSLSECVCILKHAAHMIYEPKI